MKKFYLFLTILITLSFAVSAQTVERTVINFTEMAAYEAAHPELRNDCPTCPRAEEADKGWRNLKVDLPFPEGANIKQQTFTNTPNNPMPLAPSVPTAQSWLGYVDPGQTIPPDTHGAVGVNHVITATNDYYKIHNKNGGAQVSQVSISTFFGVAGSCDPYIKFDPLSSRWFTSAIECTGANGNKTMFAISNTSDPTGTWTRYTFVLTSADGALFLDHPYMGFDNRLFVISGRKFPTAGFSGTMLFVFNKANILAGNPITFGTNAQILEKPASEGDAPLPVSVYYPNNVAGTPSSTFYILQSWNTSSIRLSTVTGNVPNCTWNTANAAYPSVPAGQEYNPGGLGNLAQQLGEARKLAVNDGRISSAVMMNGNIWCSHHVGLPVTTPDRVAVQWWSLSPTGTVLQRGRIGGATAGEYRWYSSIAVNNLDDVLIGYSISSTTTRVGAAYATRRGGATPLNTTDDEIVYKNGIATYWKDFNGGRARFGDYSHTALDPVDGSIWTVQEYAEARNGAGATDNDSRYGVWWAQVLFPSSLSDRDASLAAVVSPASGSRFCGFPINPVITIKNVGKDTLKTAQIVWQIDNVNQGTFTAFTGTPGLATFETQNVSLTPSITSLAPGLHTLKAWTQLPNGGVDQKLTNDTTFVTFNIQETLALPSTQDFEPAAAPMPPTGGWVIDNPDGARTWAKRLATINASGVASSVMWIDAANYATTGAIDMFRTPKIDLAGVDTVKFSFDVAKKAWPAFLTDSLSVVYSLDCGVTWLPTSYNRGNATLATGAPVAADFIPAAASDWRKDKLDFATCGITAPTMMIGLQFKNGYGNNIFIDNINVTKISTVQRNAGVVSINQPSATLCTNSVVPDVTIANFGTDPLTSVKVNYTIDGGAPNTLNWTGSLAKCGTATVTLPTGTSTPGSHKLVVYTSEPNASTDQYLPNDTLSKNFSISPVLNTPIFEGFESTTFSPSGWNVQNPDGLTTWDRSSAAARKGTGAMWMNTVATANKMNTVDRFFSPVVANDATVDSMFVEFDYAYRSGAQYPGATVKPLDTLEVMVSTDCGVTFKTVWKKWGEDLQTFDDPNYPNTAAFTPTQAAEWKSSSRIYLTPFVGTSKYQVYFVVKGNKENNLWIDNINITSRSLPAKIKNQGYAVYPSPFTTSFRIHHWVAPTDLKAAQVFNSVGEVVWDKRYNGAANTEEFVDMSKLAKGVYVLKMTYATKTVVERIVKL
jgi:Secretion system C-terminal sorting domain